MSRWLSYAAIYEPGKHVDTEFAILVHEDGFIVNPECWSDEFWNMIILEHLGQYLMMTFLIEINSELISG
jgi:hypothetical protein